MAPPPLPGRASAAPPLPGRAGATRNGCWLLVPILVVTVAILVLTAMIMARTTTDDVEAGPYRPFELDRLDDPTEGPDHVVSVDSASTLTGLAAGPAVVAVIRDEDSRERLALYAVEPGPGDGPDASPAGDQLVRRWFSPPVDFEGPRPVFVADDSTVYVVADGAVTAVDATTGRSRWSQSYPHDQVNEMTCQTSFDGCVAIVDDSVVVTFRPNSVATFDRATGTPGWAGEGLGPGADISVAGGHLVITERGERPDEHRLTTRDPGTGDILVATTVPCVDPTGGTIYDFDTSPAFALAPGEGASGDLVVIVARSCATRWNPVTNEVRYSVPGAGEMATYTSVVVGTDRLVALGYEQFTVLDIETGQMTRTEQSITEFPALVQARGADLVVLVETFEADTTLEGRNAAGDTTWTIPVRRDFGAWTPTGSGRIRFDSADDTRTAIVVHDGDVLLIEFANRDGVASIRRVDPSTGALTLVHTVAYEPDPGYVDNQADVLGVIDGRVLVHTDRAVVAMSLDTGDVLELPN